MRDESRGVNEEKNRDKQGSFSYFIPHPSALIPFLVVDRYAVADGAFYLALIGGDG
jgi:hypothetical protein